MLNNAKRKVEWNNHPETFNQTRTQYTLETWLSCSYEMSNVGGNHAYANYEMQENMRTESNLGKLKETSSYAH